MRKAGMNYRAIGNRLGIAHTTVYKYVKSELEKLKKQNSNAASDYRELNIQRLESMLQPIYTQALKGHLGAAERARKIIHDLSVLVGAEAPKKIASTTKDGDDAPPTAGVIVVPAVANSVEEWLQEHGPKDQ